jgi:hypothetical protein
MLVHFNWEIKFSGLLMYQIKSSKSFYLIAKHIIIVPILI